MAIAVARTVRQGQSPKLFIYHSSLAVGAAFSLRGARFSAFLGSYSVNRIQVCVLSNPTRECTSDVNGTRCIIHITHSLCGAPHERTGASTTSYWAALRTSAALGRSNTKGKVNYFSKKFENPLQPQARPPTAAHAARTADCYCRTACTLAAFAHRPARTHCEFVNGP